MQGFLALTVTRAKRSPRAKRRGIRRGRIENPDSKMGVGLCLTKRNLPRFLCLFLFFCSFLGYPEYVGNTAFSGTLQPLFMWILSPLGIKSDLKVAYFFSKDSVYRIFRCREKNDAQNRWKSSRPSYLILKPQDTIVRLFIPSFYRYPLSECFLMTWGSTHPFSFE